VGGFLGAPHYVIDTFARGRSPRALPDRSSGGVDGCARSAVSPEGTNASPYLCSEGLSRTWQTLSLAARPPWLPAGLACPERAIPSSASRRAPERAWTAGLAAEWASAARLAPKRLPWPERAFPPIASRRRPAWFPPERPIAAGFPAEWPVTPGFVTIRPIATWLAPERLRSERPLPFRPPVEAPRAAGACWLSGEWPTCPERAVVAMASRRVAARFPVIRPVTPGPVAERSVPTRLRTERLRSGRSVPVRPVSAGFACPERAIPSIASRRAAKRLRNSRPEVPILPALARLAWRQFVLVARIFVLATRTPVFAAAVRRRATRTRS
jgi:hypothetical protein